MAFQSCLMGLYKCTHVAFLTHHNRQRNIVKILACYSFNRIETLKSEKLFTYLNLDARRSHSTAN